MFKISQLISLPVINLYEVKIEGYIEKIFINPYQKKVEYILVYDENNDIYKTIKFSDIYKIGDNSLFITNSSKITLYENTELLIESLVYPLNALCYNFEGHFLGKLNEIYIEKNNIIKVNINNTEYNSSDISGLNNQLIIISTDRKINTKRFHQQAKKIKPIKISNEVEPIVTILHNSTTITPPREFTDYNFLINRTVLKDIKSQSGEIIAHKNSLVSLKLINKLKCYGKLKELTLNSK